MSDPSFEEIPGRTTTAKSDAGGASELALIYAIQNGVFEVPLWGAFLKTLRKLLGADYTALTFCRQAPAPDDLSEWYDCEKKSKAALLRERYYGSFQKLDPFPYFTMETERVWLLPDLFGTDDYARHPFYQRFLLPNAIHHFALIRIVEPRGLQAWLNLNRSGAENDFTAGDVAILTRLIPYLSTALRCFAEFEAAKISSQAYDRIMSKFDFVSFAVDEHRAVVDISSSAREAVMSSPLMSLDAQGKFRILDELADHKFSLALKSISQNASAHPQAVASSTDRSFSLLVAPIGTRVLRPGAPVAIVYYHLNSAKPAAHVCDKYETLCELFNLSDKEAQLALRLSEGQSIAEASQELQITVETARTYSKRIFVKTGTTGQTDLVRLLLKSVARLV